MNSPKSSLHLEFVNLTKSHGWSERGHQGGVRKGADEDRWFAVANPEREKPEVKEEEKTPTLWISSLDLFEKKVCLSFCGLEWLMRAGYSTLLGSEEADRTNFYV
ncbi:hypothetical protein CHARACLAT_026199 [Characodon lateralis]|uniref:Uncharacterized protein n=1 Tax=Characodon lateralis TaxID=208331 RepID=A0ABU7F6A7_9TELE|nr:hypothetical protein [Characodon lateralis]